MKKRNQESYFFTDETNDLTSANFGWQDTDSALWCVKEGYRNAADKLVDIALREGSRNRQIYLDTYIFPIMFLYRHDLEVSLKLIYHRFFGRIPNGNHDLGKLWNSVFKEIILKIESEEYVKKIEQFNPNCKKFSTKDISIGRIQNIILEIHRADINSDVWRYMVDRSANPYFSGNYSISLPKLQTCMNEVLDVLDYLYTVVSENLSGS
jgi:hypothetical protein